MRNPLTSTLTDSLPPSLFRFLRSVRNAENGKELLTLKIPSGSVNDARLKPQGAFSPDGRYLAVTAKASGILAWKANLTEHSPDLWDAQRPDGNGSVTKSPFFERTIATRSPAVQTCRD